MRLLRLFVFLCLVGIMLTILAIAFMGIFSSDLLKTIQNEDENVTDKNKQEEVEGVTIDSLYQSNSSDEFIIYLNGVDSPIVLNYKLSTGREKTISDLDGSDIGNFFPGKVIVEDEYIYWVKQNNDKFTLIKVSRDSFNNKQEEIYSKKGIDQLVGLQLLENGDIYFTEYVKETKDDRGLFNYSIVRIRNKKAQPIFSSHEQYPKIVIGVDEKNRPMLRGYDADLNRATGNCNLLENLKEIGCEGQKNIEYLLESYIPKSDGYQAGINGNIRITDKKGMQKTVLKGEIDEHFESLYYYNGYIYFVSGKVEPTSGLSNEEGQQFGIFKPVSLEKIKIDGTGRQEIKLLPSAALTRIPYVSDDYIILSMSRLSSNKYDIQPTNLWILDQKSKEMEQLTDVECKIDEFCEAVFLQKD